MARPPRHGNRRETPRIRSVRFLVAVVLIGLAGCAAQSPASQVADTADGATAPPATAGEQTASDSPTGGSGSATTTLQACDLLAPDDLAQLAVSPAANESDDATSCRWHKDDGSHMVGVTLATDLTMDAIRSAQDFTPLSLGSRDTVQYTSKGDSCLVAIELPDSSIVLTIGVAPGNVEKSCKLAGNAAEAVEPNLP